VSDLPITDEDLKRLTSLASVLLPGTAEMPASGAIANLDKLLLTAVKACGYPDTQIRAALHALPPDVDWAGAQALAGNKPAEFNVLSTLVSAAYFMDPVVVGKLGFPGDRHQPAEFDEFALEYATGILDGVTARGPRYRDAGRKAT
jgi:hypothetical protein